jgi:hypothetical protein
MSEFRGVFFALSLSQIKEAVAELPEKERGALAAWLLNSLPPNNGEDASSDAIAEAARRRGELDSKRVRLISAHEFWVADERER